MRGVMSLWVAAVVGVAVLAVPASAQSEAAKQPAKATPANEKGEEKKGEKKEAEKRDGEKPVVEFLHPLITEVYFSVGPGLGGDANGDGEREANGDEFIELVNPHDKPIQLKGYTLSAKGPRPKGGSESQEQSTKGAEDAKGMQKGKDGGKGKSRDDAGKSGGGDKEKGDFRQVKFTFPECELKLGQVVVVFNGHGAKWEGEVGDSSHAPKGGNEKFGGALVFTMRVPAERTGLSNKSDYVLLSDPKGVGVETVVWGEIEPPKDAGRVETVPVVNGESVERRSLRGGFEAESGGKKFSPGVAPK